ncbi:MAG: hypothetical protein KAT65_30475 [Methanophagales archaeon]|nr:hypothetical protein [Methanophagales archaeon]
MGVVEDCNVRRDIVSKEKNYAYKFKGPRYDAGDKFRYVKVTIAFALEM